MAESRRTPLKRTTRRAFSCRVAQATQLTPHMRRITLEAEEFCDFQPLAPDEYFGLMIPRSGTLELPPQHPTDLSPRALVALIPEDLRPDVRWYTVRQHRPALGEVDVDMVLHGEGETSGPAGRWASRARRGDVVGFCECKGVYAPEDTVKTQLFVGDETSLPALAALLESEEPAPARGRLDSRHVTVHIEVPGEDEIQQIRTDVPVHWHVRNGARPGSAVVKELERAELPNPIDYAWICAEALTVKLTRRHLVNVRGVDKSKILFSGYWRLGEARS